MSNGYILQNFGVSSGAGNSNQACVAAASQSMAVTEAFRLNDTEVFNVVFLTKQDLTIAAKSSSIDLKNTVSNSDSNLDSNSESTNKNPQDQRYSRMLSLAKLAWKNRSGSIKAQSDIPLMLGLPSEPAHLPNPAQDAFLSWFYQDVTQQAEGVPAFDIENSLIFPYGRASGLVALQAGLKLLRQDHRSAVWIGAVDSFCDDNLLRSLLERRRIATTQHEGSIPSEAAVFALLRKINKADLKDSSESSVEIFEVEYGTQTSQVAESDLASDTALGMLLQRLSYSVPEGQQIELVLPPCTGFSAQADEWAIGSYGLYPHLQAKHQSLFPALFAGDVGAADGLLKLLLTGHVSDQLTLSISHSDNLHRAAALARRYQATPSAETISS